MIFVLCVALLSVATSAVSTTNSAAVLDAFTTFQARFGKSYVNNEERNRRLAAFASNLADIDRRNGLRASDDEARFGLTKFSDLTRDEFRAAMLLKPTERDSSPRAVAARRAANDETLAAAKSLPAFFDWRKKGVVTPVKDQGQCGSCWAFSTVENIESVAIIGGRVNASVRLAPQQLVDCSDLNFGCNGGNPPFAYESVMYEGGLETEAQYPYTASGR